MKKQFFRSTIIMSVLVLFSGFIVFADSDQQIVMTLEEAQKRALENSFEYSRQDDYINDSLQDYYDTADNNDKSYGSASKGFYEYFIKPVTLEASMQSAVNNVKAARLNKLNVKRTSDLNVLKAFINIRKAQCDLENAKKESIIKSEEYEAAKAKYNMGLITKTELRKYLTSSKSASDASTAALRSLQKEMQTLNRYLGRELTDYNLKPVMDLQNIDIASIDIEKLREDYISKSENLYSLELKLSLAKRKYDLTKERHEEFSVRLAVQNSREKMEEALYDAEKEYENARKAFENATIDLDMSLKTSYDALKSLSDSAIDLQEEIEISKAESEKAKTRYDMKLIKKTEMDRVLIETETLNNKLISNLADLNLQYANLMIYSN